MIDGLHKTTYIFLQTLNYTFDRGNMLLNLATKIFGSSNERQLKKLNGYVEKINALEPEFEKLNVGKRKEG